MPTTYEELLVETLPARINTKDDYDRTRARFGELLVLRRRTRPEERLLDLLGVLIQDYDNRHAVPPDDSTPAEMLQFLVEHSGKTADELLKPVFGQRSHVHEALSGKRPISALQARKLGKLFCVAPGLFVR
jgi:HTH-type transcriptional regulator/antitoxin HigA